MPKSELTQPKELCIIQDAVIELFPSVLRILLIPSGTELNYGYHEDSDSVRTTASTWIAVLEELHLGALRVKIIEQASDTPHLSAETFYYHQPEF